MVLLVFVAFSLLIIYAQQQAWKGTATVFSTVTLKKYKSAYFYGTSEIME
jgi:hypothetical protein